MRQHISRWCGFCGTSTDHIDAATVWEIYLGLLSEFMFKQFEVEPHTLDPILHLDCVGVIQHAAVAGLRATRFFFVFFQSKAIL